MRMNIASPVAMFATPYSRDAPVSGRSAFILSARVWYHCLKSSFPSFADIESESPLSVGIRITAVRQPAIMEYIANLRTLCPTDFMVSLRVCEVISFSVLLIVSARK